MILLKTIILKIKNVFGNTFSIKFCKKNVSYHLSTMIMMFFFFFNVNVPMFYTKIQITKILNIDNYYDKINYTY